jgi:hypothetical protein
MWYQPQNLFKNDMRRGGRLALFCAAISFVWVPAIALLAAPVPPGELAATAAIPLIFSYVLIRLIMRAASGIEETTSKIKEPSSKDVVLAFGEVFFAILFVAGIWIVLVSAMSYVAYLGLGIQWAARGAQKTIQITAAIVAISAVIICLVSICQRWIVKIAQLGHEVLNRPIGRSGVPQH